MTSCQARRERREAERKSKKAAMKREKADSANRASENLNGFVSRDWPGPSSNSDVLVAEVAHSCKLDDLDDLDGFVPHTPCPAPPVKSTRRADANRANAKLSTGPRTPEGKLASSRNSTKHGLASGELIITGENPADFQTLLDGLLAEHQPATPTENLLVKEMAQSYWLAQRALRLQNECFTAEGLDEKRLALFLRYQTTHQRAFYKALNTLLRLKKEAAQAFRGSVSHAMEKLIERPLQTAELAPELDGFVSQNRLYAAVNIATEARKEAAA